MRYSELVNIVIGLALLGWSVSMWAFPAAIHTLQFYYHIAYAAAAVTGDAHTTIAVAAIPLSVAYIVVILLRQNVLYRLLACLMTGEIGWIAAGMWANGLFTPGAWFYAAGATITAVTMFGYPKVADRGR